jgi:hypothetical protein
MVRTLENQAMKQYEFKMQNNRSGQNHTVFATARTVEIARAQLAHCYKNYTLSAEPIAERAAHEVYGELNCADCTESDCAAL